MKQLILTHLKLSENRSNSVVDYSVSKGIPKQK